ncbi:MAG TPA: hypothetical protein VHE60_07810 [Pyrinomonadaceae bacterium]|nr:hypothetical protein [Pyrinomonadaceae bacterium]
MLIKKIVPFLIASGFVLTVAAFSVAQDATSQSATALASPDPQQQQEEKAKLERKATVLLEQVIAEAQALKLPENRIRVQIAAGDMLWDRNATRARGLFVDSGAGLAQMYVDADRTDRNEMQALNQLGQELVLTAARHDGELAYQLLRSAQPQTDNAGNGRRVGPPSQNAPEQMLLAAIAKTDPKLAYQKTVESLDKGEYPSSLNTVLAQLQSKDEEAFKKLSDKALSKLNSDTLLANRNADNVAIGLLAPGPRPANTSTSMTGGTNTSKSQGSTPQVLSESAYHDLMDNVIAAALTVTSLAPGGNNPRGGGAMVLRGARPGQYNPPDEAQTRQNNAGMLLFSLQTMLTQIDQYLPERAPAVRQKLSDLGINNNQFAGVNQMRALMQQGTSDSLVAAANVAPPQMQPRLYQQAAQKAVDEGNTDRAVQIASDHLDESARNSIMQAVDFKRAAINPTQEKLAEIRQKLAALPSDTDRVKFLIELSTSTQKDNPKLALRFLDDARNLVSKKATSYKDFEDQIKVADAYAALDSKQSFEVLEPGIAQLNELLSAAQVLNGFEIEIFQDGELSLRSDSELVGMIARYGEELASLAKIDFDHARMTADKFLLSEPRLNAKLSIVQSVLGVQPLVNGNNRRQNFQFVMR